MDSSPVSAFAVYRQNKSNNTSKRNQQRQKKREKRKLQNLQTVSLPKPSASFRDDEIKRLAEKLKKLERKKDLAEKMRPTKKKKKKKKSKALTTVQRNVEHSAIEQKVEEPKGNVTKKSKPEVVTVKPASVTNNVSKTKKAKGKSAKVNEKNKERIEKSSGNHDDLPILVPATDVSTEVSRRKRRRSPSNDSFSSASSSSPSSTNGSSSSNFSSVSSLSTSASKASQESFEFEPVRTDSIVEGMKVFRWMIAPYNAEDFLKSVWEKKPLYVARKKPKYYKDILTTPIIDDMLRKENIKFTKNLDITSYTDGKRETHNPVGRAHPHVVWDYYLNGCSIRLLNPQTYIPKIHLMNATLQEFFNSFVGANAYLTPPMSQGFAPHYDDIEAFILQMEGKKHWKIYKPLSINETLPRVSSKNFEQSEIGDPILEVTLEAGDLLYFPRGYIHQGQTIEGEHSLHITISLYQLHSWADLFEKMIPAALQATINENIEMRSGLPFDIYDNFGLINSDINSPRKKDLINHIKILCDLIKSHLPIDAGIDELAKRYQHEALPPVLTDVEKCVTVFGDTDVIKEDGTVENRVEISLDTRIRLLRKNIFRMVMEEDGIRLYYNIENSLEYQGNEPQFLEIDESLAPAIETLVMTYPAYVFVENLDLPGESERLQVANDLWERGLIMTEYPMDNLEED